MRRLQVLISLGTFLLLWELVTELGPIPRALVPSLTDVVSVFMSSSSVYLIAVNYGLTALRAFSGFVLGLAGGIGLGVLFSIRSMHNYIQPVATLFFAVPSVAWVPILIVWIGIKEFELPVAASFLCSFPPALYGMINALRTVDREQVDVAMVLGARPQTIFTRIVLPQALLKIIPLIKTEAVMAWKTVFVTEMIALSSGLGYLAMVYATTIEMSSLIAVVLVLALTTLAIVQVFDLIERRFSSRWVGESRWLRSPLGL